MCIYVFSEDSFKYCLVILEDRHTRWRTVENRRNLSDNTVCMCVCVCGGGGSQSIMGVRNFHLRRTQVSKMEKICLNAGFSFFPLFAPPKQSFRIYFNFLFTPLQFRRKKLYS